MIGITVWYTISITTFISPTTKSSSTKNRGNCLSLYLVQTPKFFKYYSVIGYYIYITINNNSPRFQSV